MSQRTTLLDVTLRDGGYVNDHSWTVEQARRIVAACSEAGVPFVEVGYVRPRRHGVDGDSAPSASCPPDYLARLQEVAKGSALVVMAHAADVTPAELAELSRFGVRLVRMPTHPLGILKLAPYAEAVHEAGMTFSANVIRVSELAGEDVVRSSELAARLPADIFYLADSNGSLFPEDVRRLTARVCRAPVGAFGIHTHDGIRMGFSNALTAMREGVEYVDASICGMGKGGGNLPLELIVVYLRVRERGDLTVTPLVEAATELLEPWKGAGILAKCESIASGILDLNVERLQEIRKGRPGEIFSMIDDRTFESVSGDCVRG